MALEYRLELWLGQGCVYVRWLQNTGLFGNTESTPVQPDSGFPGSCVIFCHLRSCPIRPPVSILVSLQVSYCSLSLGTAPITETVIWFLDLRTGIALARRVECAGYICNQLSIRLHCCEQLSGGNKTACSEWSGNPSYWILFKMGWWLFWISHPSRW